jgi:hypothetical protein
MSKINNVLPKPKIELYSGNYFLACGFGGIIGKLTLLNGSAKLTPPSQPVDPHTLLLHLSISSNAGGKSIPNSINQICKLGQKSIVQKASEESSLVGVQPSWDTVSKVVENMDSMKCSNTSMARNCSHMRIRQPFS